MSINRRAREYYGNREDFQRIVRRVGSPDNGDRVLASIEANLAQDNGILLIKRQTILLKRLSLALVCAFCVPVVLYFLHILTGPWTVAALGGIYFILRAVGALTERRQKAYQDRHKAEIDKHAAALKEAESRDARLRNRIDEEWDTYCINLTGYPPDWKYIVLIVLERDDRTCTQCGWPNGVKRQVRQLHVHHVERHSRGGNHALSNLVTLCDICHGKQEGPGHNRIRPRRRKSTRR